MGDFVSRLKKRQEAEQRADQARWDAQKKKEDRLMMLKSKEDDRIHAAFKIFRTSKIPEYSTRIVERIKNEVGLPIGLFLHTEDPMLVNMNVLSSSWHEGSTFYMVTIKLELDRFFLEFTGLTSIDQSWKPGGGPTLYPWSKKLWREITPSSVTEREVKRWFEYVGNRLRSPRPYLLMWRGSPPSFVRNYDQPGNWLPLSGIGIVHLYLLFR